MVLKPFLLIALLITSTTAQVKADKKFSKVPAQLRERLIERMNSYFEYERTRQYDKLYGLTSNKAVTEPEPSDKPSKEELIAEIRKWGGSIPLKVKIISLNEYRGPTDHPVYTMLLQVKSRYNGRVVDEDRLFEAHFDNGDWYFRSYHIEM